MKIAASCLLILFLCQPCLSSFSCWFTFLSTSLSNRCKHCRDSWSENDFRVLKEALDTKLFGQHIAKEMVQRHLKAHLINTKPRKALVLSLHGTIGSGKNYLTQISMKSLMPDGMKNIYVKYWHAKRHFPDKSKLGLYQEVVSRTIMDTLKDCPRSVFIFDDADLQPALLDFLSPMMEENALLDGVDTTKAIFIFISNTAATIINDFVWNHMKNKGRREDLGIRDFQLLIQENAFMERGGFQHSKLMAINSIDSYVPFLPLQREQVRKCVEYYFTSRGCPFESQAIEDILDAVTYEPDTRDGFATSGCRLDSLIMYKVDSECLWKTPRTEL